MDLARSPVHIQQWHDTVAQAVSSAGIIDEEVESLLFKAFLAMPRDSFVDEVPSDSALSDLDVPLGYDQWLTNPTLLVRMASLIHLRKRMRILELGFGSGYLCAVMAHAGAQVFGVEQIGLLAQRTRRNLDRLGHHGVVVRRGEGIRGWGESGPYDAMVISYPVVSEGEIPFDQLRRGGTAVGVLRDSGDAASEPSGLLTVWTRGLGPVRKVSFERVLLR
jgi:protein-L-isoaspartate(D-aspartate) O-methyltransferase